jgi:hypothetical protein
MVSTTRSFDDGRSNHSTVSHNQNFWNLLTMSHRSRHRITGKVVSTSKCSQVLSTVKQCLSGKGWIVINSGCYSTWVAAGLLFSRLPRLSSRSIQSQVVCHSSVPVKLERTGVGERSGSSPPRHLPVVTVQYSSRRSSRSAIISSEAPHSCARGAGWNSRLLRV